MDVVVTQCRFAVCIGSAERTLDLPQRLLASTAAPINRLFKSQNLGTHKSSYDHRHHSTTTMPTQMDPAMIRAKLPTLRQLVWFAFLGQNGQLKFMYGISVEDELDETISEHLGDLMHVAQYGYAEDGAPPDLQGNRVTRKDAEDAVAGMIAINERIPEIFPRILAQREHFEMVAGVIRQVAAMKPKMGEIMSACGLSSDPMAAGAGGRPRMGISPGGLADMRDITAHMDVPGLGSLLGGDNSAFGKLLFRRGKEEGSRE